MSEKVGLFKRFFTSPKSVNDTQEVKEEIVRPQTKTLKDVKVPKSLFEVNEKLKEKIEQFKNSKVI